MVLPLPEQIPRLKCLGNIIRQARYPFSIYWLSKQCGYSPSYVSRLERGLRRPRRETLAAISRALGLNLNQLVEIAGPGLAPPSKFPKKRD